MPRPPLPRTYALIQMHLATVLFGISSIFGILITSSAEIIVFGRILFALTALSLFFAWRRTTPWQTLQAKQFVALIISGMLLTSHWVTFYIAVKIGGVAMSTLGFACFPAFVALFETLFFKERLTRHEIIMLCLVSIGLILLVPDFNFSSQGTLGLLWGVLSAVVYAILALFNRNNVTSVSGSVACWWQYLTALLVLFPWITHELPQVTLEDWFWIACLGLLCTSLAYTLFVSSLRTLNARTASTIIALEPVYAITAAWILFQEVPGWRTFIGGGLIIYAVLQSSFAKGKLNRSQSQN